MNLNYKDWEMTMSEEDNCNFEKAREEITLTETIDPLLGVRVHSDEQLSWEFSGQTDTGKTTRENQTLFPE